MALMQCPECGKEISDQVPACPHCGFPVQKQTGGDGKDKKKKFIPLIIIGSIFILAAALFICYKFVYQGSFEITLSKDTVELGTDVDLLTYLEYDPENIIEVSVTDDGNFDAGTAGEYQVMFRIKNKRGNIKEVPFAFHVTDTVAPELSVLKDTVYVAKGSEYDPQTNAEASDADTCTIEIGGEYDLHQEGTYEISFSAKDGSGNTSETKSMKLIVENRDDCVFRNVKFGDSAEVVKRYETSDLLKENDDKGSQTLIYGGSVENEDAYIYYDMNQKDQLYAITIIFNETHTDNDMYLSLFEGITEKLTALYGEAKIEKVKGSLYSYCSTEGEALNLGQVKYRNTWDTDDLSVYLYLGKDNYEVSFGLLYESKNFEKPEEDNSIK